jgi:hypothetical protein
MLDNDKKRQPKSDIKYSLSLTDEQKIAKQKILESTVVFLLGEAGTAKCLHGSTELTLMISDEFYDFIANVEE